MDIELVVGLAFIIDLMWGDPVWVPRPGRGIAVLAARAEPIFRQLTQRERLAGILTVGFALYITFGMAFLVLYETARISSFIAGLISVALIYTTLSMKSLSEGIGRVEKCLEEKDADAARTELRDTVGHDVSPADEIETARFTIGAAADGLVAKVTAPLFYGLILGAPLALAYVVVITMNAYSRTRDERTREFAWAAGKLNDLANVLPAALTGLLAAVAASFCGGSGEKTWKLMWRDGRRHPGSDLIRAAFAGALGVQLDGAEMAGGKPAEKSTLGDPVKEIEVADIGRAHLLMIVTGILSLVAFCLLSFIIRAVVSHG